MSEFELISVRLAFTCQLRKRNTIYSLRQNICNNNKLFH